MSGILTLEVEVTNISKFGFWLLVNNEELFVSFELFPWFRNASVDKIFNVQVLHETHFYWPDLDIDLSYNSLKSPEQFPLVYR